MIILNRQGDMITGSVDGNAFSISYDQEKFELMSSIRDEADNASTVEQLKEIVDRFTPLTVESFKNLVETASPYVVVNKHTNKYYLQYGGKISRHAFPQPMVDRILKSIEKGIDIAPLVKCWARFLRPVPGKPDYTNARGLLFAQYINADYVDDQKLAKLMSSEGLDAKIATAMATSPQVAITQEGLLVCYKVSKEITKKFVKNAEQDGGVKEVDRYDYEVDEFSGLKTYQEPTHVEDRVFEPAIMGQGGDAFKSGDRLGHIIRVGLVHELEKWEQVNCDNSTTGKGGLHVGGLRYINGYQTDGTVTHNVFVDPMDIGAIVGLGHGNDGAMRVRRYFVHSSFAGPNKNIYHSSKYAAVTDAEYATMIEEIVKETQMKKKEADEILEQEKALTTIDKSNHQGLASTDLGSTFGK